LVEDFLVEWGRLGLPKPSVTVSRVRGVAGRGLEGHLRIVLGAAIAGPIVLGRTRFLGGGLFAKES
jgi:CRISPR-associated protein Csb2